MTLAEARALLQRQSVEIQKRREEADGLRYVDLQPVEESDEEAW